MALVVSGCLIDTDAIEEATVVTAPDARTSASLAEPTVTPTPSADTASSFDLPESAAEAVAAGAVADTPTVVPEPTVAPEPTVRPEPTVVPTELPAATATAVPAPTQTPIAEPTATPEPAATATVEATATPDLLSYTDIRDVACPTGLEDASITCKMVKLPEDDQSPEDGRTVELFVSLIDNGDPIGAGPVVILQGGPGVAIAHTADDYVGTGLDTILVDQRGAGLSIPSLDCSEYVGLFSTLAELASRAPEALQFQLDANQACRDRLVADGIRLSAFNSEQNADDIALLRQVLGYDEWNVYGSSYGTRLALTLLRDHPEGIRTVVLDAVLPLEVDFFGELPANAERALNALNTACVEQVACAATYGDLTTLLDDAADGFDANNVTLSITREADGGTIDAVIDGPAIRRFVFDQMYSDDALPKLPRLIQAAVNGDVTELATEALQGQDSANLDFAEAMYWAVFCAEEVAYYDSATDDEVMARRPESFFLAHGSGDLDEICGVWDVPSAPAIDNEPVTSSLPTLLFSGGLDPVTPPAWAEIVTATLDDAFLVRLPRQSHGAANDCVGDILSDFLVTPSSAPDTACVDTSPIPFE